MALTAGSPVQAAPTPADPTASTATQSVIVLLRDQLTGTPANRSHVASRRDHARADQATVLNRLHSRGGRTPTNVDHYTAANAFSATVTSDQAAALAADPSVAEVIPNVKIELPVPANAAAATANGTARSKAAKAAVAPVDPSVCPTDPTKPLLEPEALTDTHTASDDTSAKTAQALGATGAGVKVAYIADGINPDNADFIRADGSKVIVDYKAFSADGPAPEDGGAEAYGDASAIAAQGLVSHDLSKFVNPAYPLPTGCNIRILGMSPGASIVALKIDFYTSSIIQAIDYAVSVDHVDVINESFGGAPIPDASARSAIQTFNDMAVAAGATVTVSSGDAGTTSTIGNPSTDPNVISVAANTNNRGYAQTGYAGARTFGNGKWINDQISSLSSGGFTNEGRTVDLTAPGESGWAVCDPGAPECRTFRATGGDVQLFGGTSQSAPLTAGAAALVIQAYRYSHGGASPSPALVKKLLTSTATDLGLPTYEQGAGLLDSRAAVEAALTYPGSDKTVPAGISSNVVLSADQVSISGAPGSTHTVNLGVQNVGTKPLTIAASTRDYLDTAVQTQTTAIDASSSQTFPYPTNGAPWVYKKVSLTVPAGTDRLAAQMIWQGAARTVGTARVTPVVRLSLFAPDGTYVANSRPQGGAVSANYANLDVRKPVAGTWTAVLYTVAGASGYTGDVTLRTTSQQNIRVGTVNRPAFTLKAGQSRNVKVRLTIPENTGDHSVAITVASSDGHQTAVAVVERAVVPISKGTGDFAGTITGGNGRAGAAAQTLTYAFDVPAGKKDVGVGITLPDDPGYQLQGVLVDPNDETQSVASNRYTNENGELAGQGSTLQLTSANPVAGRWRLIVLVVNPVPGRRLTEDFTGTIAFDQSKASTTGVPNSASTVLARGKATTATVSVTNTGIAPMVIQLDPRTNTLRQIPLNSPFGPQSFTLPDHAAPAFLVPPGTKALTAAAVSEVPATVELQSSAGGIDVIGGLKQGKNGSTVSVARVSENPGTVASGVWFTDVAEVGYFGTDGAPEANSTVDLTARTPEFDSAVSSGTGDFWSVATDPEADTGVPVTINPGSTITIPVTITPNAKVGTVVSGVINVIVPPSFAYATFNTTGDVVARLPYRYTVGKADTSAAAAATSAVARSRVSSARTSYAKAAHSTGSRSIRSLLKH